MLIFAPDSLHGVGRIEHNVEKLRLLWGEGYQHGVERMEELEAFLLEKQNELTEEELDSVSGGISDYAKEKLKDVITKISDKR